MLELKKKLLAVAIGSLLSFGAFAQRKEEDRRPPKENPKVVVQPKGERDKPQQNKNSNQGDKKDDRKGRP